MYAHAIQTITPFDFFMSVSPTDLKFQDDTNWEEKKVSNSCLLIEVQWAIMSGNVIQAELAQKTLFFKLLLHFRLNFIIWTEFMNVVCDGIHREGLKISLQTGLQTGYENKIRK